MLLMLFLGISQGGWRILGDHVVFRGNRGEISRRQQCVKGDCGELGGSRGFKGNRGRIGRIQKNNIEN